METKRDILEVAKEWASRTKFGVFIPTQGKPAVVDLAGGTYGTELETLQFAVSGWVQAVSLAQKWEGFTIWVNEEAKLIQGMEFNKVATQIWAESFEGYSWGADDYILGNAVITLDDKANGEILGMTELRARGIAVTLGKDYTL
jgi:hypothetical protein